MNIPRYFGFTEFTPVIPQLYWNVYSNEQRMKAICKELCKLIHYADMLGINVQELKEILQEIQEGKFDEQISEAIEQWFEENEPEIMQQLENISESVASIDAKIGGNFDETHTVDDAIEENKDAIEELGALLPETAFSTNHSVKDAIDAVDNKLVMKNFAFPAFEVIDRFIIDEIPNSYSNSYGQIGIVFQQGSMLYSASLIGINSTSANTIRIRNAKSHQFVADYPINNCHGLSLDYNPNTKQLLWYDENQQAIYLLDVSTPAAPTPAGVYSTSGTNMQYGVCWYGNNFLMFYTSNGNRLIDIVNPSTMETIRTLQLDMKSVTSFIYQDITVMNDILLIGCSFPNMIVFVDIDTGKALNVLNIDTHYGHVVILELEGISTYGNRICFSSIAGVDGVALQSILGWNYKTGNSKQDETSLLWASSDDVGTLIVNYDTGSLVEPINDNRRTFKLAGDAENFAKFNYPCQRAIISFESDYPYYPYFTGISLNVTLHGHELTRGARFSCIPFLGLKIEQGTTVGDAIIIDGTTANIQNPGNIARKVGYTQTIFWTNTSIIFTNGTINNSSFQYTEVLAPTKPQNSTAYRCFYNEPINSWD